MTSPQCLNHGSKAGLSGPIRPISRSACDFGRGFYMGDSVWQPQTLICDAAKPKLYTCKLDLSGLRTHEFEPNIDWAMFVAWNRRRIPNEFQTYYDSKFKPLVQSTDVFVGKIANDRMFVVLGWFFDEFISDIGLLEALDALKLGNQYVCMTQAACDHVSVIEERTLPPEECERLRKRATDERVAAVKAVDKIRRAHRRDGRSFLEIIEEESGGTQRGSD